MALSMRRVVHALPRATVRASRIPLDAQSLGHALIPCFSCVSLRNWLCAVSVGVMVGGFVADEARRAKVVGNLCEDIVGARFETRAPSAP